MRPSEALKHRAVGTTRDVPLPPQPVLELRRHLQLVDDPNGPLFLNTEGRPMTASNYSDVWRRARTQVWGKDPDLADTKLYDLRHAAATVMHRFPRRCSGG